jgi:hypothetical protein
VVTAAAGGVIYFNSISGASKSVSIVNSIIADNYAPWAQGMWQAAAAGV